MVAALEMVLAAGWAPGRAAATVAATATTSVTVRVQTLAMATGQKRVRASGAATVSVLDVLLVSAAGEGRGGAREGASAEA